MKKKIITVLILLVLALMLGRAGFACFRGAESCFKSTGLDLRPYAKSKPDSGELLSLMSERYRFEMTPLGFAQFKESLRAGYELKWSEEGIVFPNIPDGGGEGSLFALNSKTMVWLLYQAKAGYLYIGVFRH